MQGRAPMYGCIIMIRKNTINCKLFFIKKSKKSGFSVFNEAMDSFKLIDEVCPTCGRKGDCAPHAGYSRYLIDFCDGRPESRQIEVRRVICPCGATHAILPDPIVPYDQYSLFYILLVLAVYFCHIMTVEQICEKYMITPRTLYRWAGVYSEHRREWQGLLDATSSDVRRSLLELAGKDPFSSFATTFIKTTAFSFLQSHANPANCRQNLQFASPPTATNTR